MSKVSTPQTDDLYDLFPLQHYSSSSRSARQGRQIPDLYDLAHAAAWESYRSRTFPGLDLYYTDPAQHTITAR